MRSHTLTCTFIHWLIFFADLGLPRKQGILSFPGIILTSTCTVQNVTIFSQNFSGVMPVKEARAVLIDMSTLALRVGNIRNNMHVQSSNTSSDVATVLNCTNTVCIVLYMAVGLNIG